MTRHEAKRQAQELIFDKLAQLIEGYWTEHTDLSEEEQLEVKVQLFKIIKSIQNNQLKTYGYIFRGFN